MNFLGLQFLDILNFLGGATILDNFIKTYGAIEEKCFFPYEWFDSIEKLNVSQLPPIDSFSSKLKDQNLPWVEYNKFMKFKNGGMEQDEILKKLETRENSTKCRRKLLGAPKYLGKGRHAHFSGLTHVVRKQRCRTYT